MKNEIQERAFDFSIRIAELVSFLREDPRGFPLCERLLVCGVETGLACRASSDSRYPAKRAKQAAAYVMEADYIIEMAQVAGYLTQEQCIHIRADCSNLFKLLASGTTIDEPYAGKRFKE
ncbi:MAG: four helix bundle protein [Lacrimispora sp.]|uniref:four helix bundle protein n=1 Tax=Lacrimispora sp. TaxID=2719234 RepID=UPI0039E28176